MEENLDINNEVNKEIAENTTKSNDEEIKNLDQKKISKWIKIMAVLKVIPLQLLV